MIPVFPFSFWKKTNAIPPIVQSYITAAGITSPTEITAITNLYNSLVSYGIWSSFDRIWLISPTSLTAASYDFVGENQLTFVNAPSFSSSGVAFDGATQYATSDTTMNNYTNYAAINGEGCVTAYVQSYTLLSGIRYPFGCAHNTGMQS